MRVLRFVLIFCSLLCFLGAGARSAHAQSYRQAVGAAVFATPVPVQNGYVDAANGDLHLDIPLGTFPQRNGTRIVLTLAYDSNIWIPIVNSNGAVWEPTNVSGSNGGWRIITSADVGTSLGPTLSVDHNCDSGDSIEYGNFVWIDPTGAQHLFPITTEWQTGCGYTDNPTGSGYAEDGTGYLMYVTDHTIVRAVYAPDGSQVYPTVKDANGNYLPNQGLAYSDPAYYGCTGHWDERSGFTWVGPDGTVHSFSITTDQGANVGCPDNPTGNATDSAGYTMYVTNYSSVTVNDPHGVQVYPNSNVVDSLGRTLLTYTTNPTGFTVLNSQGGRSQYKLNWENIPVCTNFNDHLDTEYCGLNGGTITTLQSITLPDNSAYSFTYDQGTSAGNYGIIKSMTVPTGVTISYQFTNYVDAYSGTSRWIKNLTTPDSANPWIFFPTAGPICGNTQVNCSQTTKVTEPSGDYTVYTFVLNGGAWPATIQTYSATGTLLSTTNQCWNFVTVTNGVCSYNVTTGSQAANVQKLAVSRTLPTPNGSITATTQYQYDIYGNVTLVKENNFYTGTLPSTADRTTNISYSYQGNSFYLNANILNRPTNVTVTNSGGATGRQTKYCYDDNSGTGGCNTPNIGGSPSTIVSHDDTNYGSNQPYRGNPTQVQRLISGSNYAISSMTYDMTGQRTLAKDPNGNQATYSYSDNFFNDAGNGSNPSSYSAQGPTNAYLTSVTLPGGLQASMGYYWGTGQSALIKDFNSKFTYFHYYDAFSRPTATSFPDGGWNETVYTGQTQIDRYVGINTGMTTNCPSSFTGGCRHDETVLDGLGRTSSNMVVNDPEGQVIVGANYDLNGRLHSVTNPYRSSSESTYGVITISSYDGLDRPLTITEQDGSQKQTYYGATVSSNGGIATKLCSGTRGFPVLMVDEVGHKRQTWTDGFGRLIEVDEPDSNNNLTVSTCYSYDLNDSLTQVVQGSETRTFTYDSLSRLVCAANPETQNQGTVPICPASPSSSYPAGTTSYTYDANGNVHTKTDARQITATSTYDGLNRLTQTTYSDGTPTDQYYYDRAIGDLGGANLVGRLVGAYTINPSSGAALTELRYSYDSMGRVGESAMCPTSTCHQDDVAYAFFISRGYDLAGDLTVDQVGQGQNNYANNYHYQHDSTGRPNTLYNSMIYCGPPQCPNGDPNHPYYLALTDYNSVTTPGYWPNGALRAFLMPDGVFPNNANMETTVYNSRLQPCRIDTNHFQASISKCSDPTPSSSDLDFSYAYHAGTQPNNSMCTEAGGQNNGNVACWATSPASSSWARFSRSYLYDNLNRLNSMSSPGDQSGCYGYSWTYDPYGNRLTQAGTSGSNCMQPNYGLNGNNQITGFGYDAAGNVTNDTVHTYTYDAKGQLIKVDGGSTATYTYDAERHRVAKTTSAGMRTFVYDADGSLATEIGPNGGFGPVYFYFAGKLVGEYYNSTTYYFHHDHLGSGRIVTATGGFSPAFAIDLLPFGEATGDENHIDRVFTSYLYDSETDPGNGTGLDYAEARYYSPRIGRFLTPDPLGGRIDDPQTLNRYAYVRDNPINMVDPSGMDECSYVINNVLYTYCVGNGGGSGGSDSFGFSGFGPYYQPTCAFGSCGGISRDAPGTRTYCLDEARTAGLTAKERTQMCPYQGSAAQPATNLSKSYGLTTPCGSTASQVMGAVEGNFAQFGNYSRWGGLESVTFSPPAGMGPGSTIPISVSVFGFTQNLSVNVQSMNSQSMTFTTNPGHLIYPGSITFAASPASPGSINFNINLGGTVASPAQFYFGGSSFEDAQWNHFLGKVGGFCKVGG